MVATIKRINNNRTTALEYTVALAAGGLMHLTGTKPSH